LKSGLLIAKHFEKFFGIFKDKEISVEEERDLMISERA